ncbi:MAG: hypothetical protein ACOYOH_00345 [Paracraurococcus sp.]|jgi:hypothetical protein
MATVFSANKSSVLVDGEAVEGLQSLTYRVQTEQEDVRGVGTDERVAVVFGLRTVLGELAVKSVSTKLDDMLGKQAAFQLVADLKQDESETSPKRKLSFDGCYVQDKRFSLAANGSVLTTYAFTATRLRET